MYDSVTATDIPTSAAMVAGYVSGRFAWSAADWARFPNAVKVGIATQANVNDGQVLDVEPGDATPAQSVGWVQMRRQAGTDPTVYCNASTLPQVQSAFTSAGVAQPHYWVAHYDGKAEIPAGCVAKQYIDPPGSGGHYDLSAVADFWPGVDPGPGTPPPNGKDEGVYKTFQPGSHVQDVMDVAGCSKLRVLTGWGRTVTIHRFVFVADTDYSKNPGPGDSGGTYDQGFDGPDWVFVPDRPGPYDIPQAPHPAVQLAVEYSADHAFDLSAH